MSADKNSISYMTEYLHHATELEKYKYIWNGSLSKINTAISNVIHEKQRTVNAIHSADREYADIDQTVEKEYKEEEQSVKKKKTRYIPIVILLLLICYILPLIPNVVKAISEISEYENFIEGFTVYANNNSGGVGTIAAIIIAGIAAILFWIFILCRNSFKSIRSFKKKKNNQYWKKEGESRKKSVLAQKKQNETRLIVCKSKEQALSKQRAMILNNLRQVTEKLDELYSENILPQKYRNFVAVATMYEYLSTGRCTEIKGHGGMIDTYEYDCKMGIIIANLNQINQKLSIIAQNQRMLFDELQTANSHLNNISDNISSIEKHVENIDKNTAISAAADQQSEAILRWAVYQRPSGW